MTEVDIVGTAPRAVRSGAFGNDLNVMRRAFAEHYGYINTSTPYPRQRGTRNDIATQSHKPGTFYRIISLVFAVVDDAYRLPLPLGDTVRFDQINFGCDQKLSL